MRLAEGLTGSSEPAMLMKFDDVGNEDVFAAIHTRPWSRLRKSESFG
jgi:hypothetical protein